jgi:hypothetical protein
MDDALLFPRCLETRLRTTLNTPGFFFLRLESI